MSALIRPRHIRVVNITPVTLAFPNFPQPRVTPFTLTPQRHQSTARVPSLPELSRSLDIVPHRTNTTPLSNRLGLTFVRLSCCREQLNISPVSPQLLDRFVAN
ncbi:hypothetical protein HBI82_200940 [Parastagonospora nodorum]|nr:hypothetical protein HBI74_124340 [Parastagonospora nodorum]KAH5421219.1 hypothetical protein HBI46_085530 [Parastagonospora nodorum]KAH5789585.1 hypothetical protein HBI97_067060 [Parastagonospora nodorum]KAH5825517.1 hypothetical protein HBI94_077720 [Parastagonospora nodorum]KAH5838937.1 hypothetical protein HBI93_063800 [Parastagonospora nodorum]